MIVADCTPMTDGVAETDSTATVAAESSETIDSTSAPAPSDAPAVGSNGAAITEPEASAPRASVAVPDISDIAGVESELLADPAALDELSDPAEPSPPPPSATTEIATVTGVEAAPAGAAAPPEPTMDLPVPDPPALLSVDPAPTVAMPSIAMATASALAKPPKRKHTLRVVPMGSIAALTALAGLVTAWGLDQARTSDQVMRGTLLGTTPIGGLDQAGLDAVIDSFNTDLGQAALNVSAGDRSVDTNPVAMGAELDHDGLSEAAFDARRQGSLALRPFRWLATFFTTQTIDPSYVVDLARAEQAANEIVTPALDQPVDPELVLDGTDLTVSPGRPGLAVAGQQVVDALPPELAGNAPYKITLTPASTEPRFSNETIQRVADEANGATKDNVVFRVLDRSAEVEPAAMRQWVRLDTTGDTPTWQIEDRQALNDLQPLFPGLGSEDQKAKFSIVDGRPIIVPASETVICCRAESVAGIGPALLTPASPPADDGSDKGDPRVVTLEPEIVGSDEGVAELESLGIIEEVSSFTTKHPCCANRVTNIHRFADLMQGAIIRPGENFSLNSYVGERTIAKGFVADHAIVEGVLEDQVGGGVSQFATTFFNASFFAGLNFNEYQSHSLYISRYPRGREATISWRKPDLSVKNTTGYGILVWPTYTDTSLTVTFYSTKHIDVQALDLYQTEQGKCSRVTTPRIRTYPDGRKLEDSVFALYRPGEGFDCNGNPTRPPDGKPEGPTIVADDAASPASIPDPPAGPVSPGPAPPAPG